MENKTNYELIFNTYRKQTTTTTKKVKDYSNRYIVILFFIQDLFHLSMYNNRTNLVYTFFSYFYFSNIVIFYPISIKKPTKKLTRSRSSIGLIHHHSHPYHFNRVNALFFYVVVVILYYISITRFLWIDICER